MTPVILLERFAYAPHGVLGRCKVSVAPGMRLWSVERPWVGNQVSVSCIPEGVYPCRRHTWLTKPGAEWMLEAVPDRSAILFHVANHQEDLEGCIGLGTSLAGFWQEQGFLLGVGNSRDAMREFNAALRQYEEAVVVVAFTGNRPAGASLEQLVESARGLA